MIPRTPTILVLLLAFLFTWNVKAQSKRALFVRGGTGTVGFLEGFGDDQAASILDFSTANGNHGWGSLADVLESEGFELSEVMEGPSSNNTPIAFDEMDLSQYSVIVLGSNNADYTTAQVDAIETYVRNGGGLLIISDANFGLSWQDASNSDQPFLDRFGLIMNQDHGTYQVRRTNNDYLVPDHPILEGVNSFKGEGVTPITLADETPAGVTTQILARVPPDQDFRVNPGDSRGGLVDPTEKDGTLIIALAGSGRVACHFDRNTFFNQNGAGSDIFEHDNEQYARNLFNWLAEDLATDPRPRNVMTSLDSSSARLKLSFEIPQTPPTGTVYQVLSGDGLPVSGSSIAQKIGDDEWTSTSEISITNLPDNYTRIEIEDTTTTSQKRFLWLRVSAGQ